MFAKIVTVTLAAVLLAGSVVVWAEDKADEKTPSLEDYAKASKPGPQHKLLEPLNGSWTFSGKFWMDPAKPPTDMKGTTERKWILGGRFLQDDTESPGFTGEKFLGLGLTGYDNAVGKYTTVWLDNMSTGMSPAFGTVDDSGKVFTYLREDFDPVLKKKIKGKDVTRIIDKNSHTLEMYREMDGKEVKVMEITFTRKSK